MAPQDRREDEEKWTVLRRYQELIETPLMVLGFIWLVLIVIEFTRGPGGAVVAASTAIWIIFIADFILQFALAPDKKVYIRGNLLTLVSLTVPALRILRAFKALQALRGLRAARVVRGARLVQVIGSVNRSMGILGEVLGRRKFGYVLALTAIVVVTGAAGIYVLERENDGFGTFGAALWWSAMMITTMGSQYWPQTPEGRVLCFLLAVYAFTVFGYVTAVLASLFIGLDRFRERGVEEAEIRKLREEVRAALDKSKGEK
ncbi:MAG: potassium channel family protein [Deltaproteobacteria bacterium]|nr:potassium channel family protein [Deltaproteobacteria bacterium]MBZ0219476.1 ion transporter [Deltaproteobacteria bacterium]